MLTRRALVPSEKSMGTEVCRTLIRLYAVGESDVQEETNATARQLHPRSKFLGHLSEIMLIVDLLFDFEDLLEPRSQAHHVL